MVDYNALRKKFPTKDPQKKKRVAAIKAIKREYAAKRAALGGGAPAMKKGVVFYAVVILGLMILGSLILSVAGKGGPKEISRAQILVRKSVDSVAVALGRYRYHVGSYPSTEEGLEALAAITPRKKGWNGPYVNHVVKDPWGHDYVYVNNGESEYPTLYSKGPDGKAGTTDDVLPDRALYDEPFKDTSWTKGWMPYYLRGYVLAPDKRTKGAIEEEVKAVLAAEQGPAEGEFVLHDGWEFSRDQKSWTAVRVPHDWAIAGPFDEKLDHGTGMLPWQGVGYYRRTIELPADSAGKFVALRFGGVMSRPEVFLNGEKVGGWDYGYMSFEVDISAKLKFGEKNELLVKADTTKHHSRWYPGAGIYRDVKLVVEDAEPVTLRFIVPPYTLPAESLSSFTVLSIAGPDVVVSANAGAAPNRATTTAARAERATFPKDLRKERAPFSPGLASVLLLRFIFICIPDWPECDRLSA